MVTVEGVSACANAGSATLADPILASANKAKAINPDLHVVSEEVRTVNEEVKQTFWIN